MHTQILLRLLLLMSSMTPNVCLAEKRMRERHIRILPLLHIERDCTSPDHIFPHLVFRRLDFDAYRHFPFSIHPFDIWRWATDSSPLLIASSLDLHETLANKCISGGIILFLNATVSFWLSLDLSCLNQNKRRDLLVPHHLKIGRRRVIWSQCSDDTWGRVIIRRERERIKCEYFILVSAVHLGKVIMVMSGSSSCNCDKKMIGTCTCMHN